MWVSCWWVRVCVCACVLTYVHSYIIGRLRWEPGDVCTSFLIWRWLWIVIGTLYLVPSQPVLPCDLWLTLLLYSPKKAQVRRHFPPSSPGSPQCSEGPQKMEPATPRSPPKYFYLAINTSVCCLQDSNMKMMDPEESWENVWLCWANPAVSISWAS